MRISENIENIKAVLLEPVHSWSKIKFQSLKIKNFYLFHLGGILAIVFISRILGKSLALLAVSNIYYILLYAFFSLVCELASFYFSAVAVNKLLPSYGVKENINKLSLLLFYSLLPYYFFSATISLFPSMYFLGIISLYGLVIYWYGAASWLKIKNEDNIIFYVISTIIVIGIHLILRFIVVLPFFKVL